MATLSIRNWAEFQHYKNRCPPWIKLHRGLLDNIEYHNLSPESAKFLPLIWLIMPISKGGNSDKSNLQLLCLPCNRSKRTKVGKPAEQVATQNQQYSYDRHSLEGETERELELELEIEAALPSASPQPLTVVSKRGSRIQSTWKASEEMIQFCRTERPDLNPLAVEAEFLDYWSAQPGQRGVKLDWDATWRNWVRRQRAGPKPNGQSKTMQALDNIERQARQ